MDIGTLMAAVRWTYWIANALSLQVELVKGPDTR